MGSAAESLSQLNDSKGESGFLALLSNFDARSFAPLSCPHGRQPGAYDMAKAASGNTNHALVIVESPAKAKTLKKYLGPGYEVLASKGHIKDLPKRMGIDVEHDFQETYEVIEGKAKVVAELKGAAQKVDEILLATDPDREGEAIAMHIAEELRPFNRPMHRVLFHEITKRGVAEGIANPLELNENLYEAQRTRRVLDRLVGYDVSALVWSKVAFGLSAGRVQSVALRLIALRRTWSGPHRSPLHHHGGRSRRRGGRADPAARRRHRRREPGIGGGRGVGGRRPRARDGGGSRPGGRQPHPAAGHGRGPGRLAPFTL